jgi:hypothetical protein
VGGSRRAAALLSAGLSAGLLAGLLAGCRTSPPAAPPALPGASQAAVTASPTPTAGVPAGPGAALVRVTSGPPGDRTQARIFADYVRFWQRDMLALRSNDLGTSGLLAYLFPPQLQTTATYLSGQRRAGRHTEGTITISPQVTSVRGSSATVDDCLDESRSYDVDRAGRRAAATGPRRLALTVALQLGTDKRWKVSNLGRRSGTC